jgi:hypothetical protein
MLSAAFYVDIRWLSEKSEQALARVNRKQATPRAGRWSANGTELQSDSELSTNNAIRHTFRYVGIKYPTATKRNPIAVGLPDKYQGRYTACFQLHLH